MGIERTIGFVHSDRVTGEPRMYGVEFVRDTDETVVDVPGTVLSEAGINFSGYKEASVLADVDMSASPPLKWGESVTNLTLAAKFPDLSGLTTKDLYHKHD